MTGASFSGLYEKWPPVAGGHWLFTPIIYRNQAIRVEVIPVSQFCSLR
ncbi:hypothetical protein HMPREF9374_0540 [Desmospora sp. 8437]|nr:hypothetical protein HMPREF9374_0540 [Desmospora sp. 8437]